MWRTLFACALICPAAALVRLAVADDRDAASAPTSRADPPALTTPPVLVSSSCKKPQYPLESLNANEAGAVLLKLLVDPKGTVTQSVIERSSGYQRLDEVARAALQLCKFKPATVNGKPTSAWAPIEYVWTLKEPDSTKTKPVLIASSCKRPQYPTASFGAEETGVVLLRFLVDPEGKVAKSIVERSSGYPRLDEAARTALELCKFDPATLDGKATSAWTAIEYVWTIRDPEDSRASTAINTTPRLAIGSCEKPQYPAAARESGESGTVQLKLVVNPTGKVVDSKVVRSSGFERLDEAARRALEVCNFEPAVRERTPRTASVELEYVWSLTGPSGVRLPPAVLPDSCDKPQYPQLSRRRNETGKVALRFFIDETGMVVMREVERSSGYQLLDNAAAAGLSLCKFRPATFDGKPTGAWTRMEYVFRLE